MMYSTLPRRIKLLRRKKKQYGVVDRLEDEFSLVHEILDGIWEEVEKLSHLLQTPDTTVDTGESNTPQ